MELVHHNNNIQPDNQTFRYLFVPSNDTHVHWMLPLAKALEKSFFMVIAAKNEQADFYLDKLKVQFLTYRCGILQTIQPGVIVFGCDWGGYEQQVIREAKALGIPTVCIQEGCLDFQDSLVGRMMRSDYAFLQGPVMRKYLARENNVIVTGNPKYDSLYESPLPEKVTVMINCNFAYGIYESWRDQWIEDVVESCRELGLDFFISQHPRDNKIFPNEYQVIKSDAFKMFHQLRRTSILVSRFSTVIYEAVMMGREVVYYNPHNEHFRIFKEDNTGGILIANNRMQLLSALHGAISNLGKNNEKRSQFLLQHCGNLSHNAGQICKNYLQKIAGIKAETKSPVQTNTGINKNRKRILLYTDSRGNYIKGHCDYKHYGKRLAELFDVDMYLCPEKWTTTLDFLELRKKIRLEDYDAIVLHTGIVDASPRHQKIALEKIYPPKKAIFDEIFGEQKIWQYLNTDLGCDYEDDKTINLYSLDMAKECLLPALKKIPNLIWIGGNRIVPGWRGNYWKERPTNISLIEMYFSLFASELEHVVDLMGWSYDEIKRYTFDNMHPNKEGSDYIFERTLQKIHEVINNKTRFSSLDSIPYRTTIFSSALNNNSISDNLVNRISTSPANRMTIDMFANKYKGRRAFIIGNGPSLNKLDMTKLKDEITFGVNNIFYNFDKMGFKPTFYVVEDRLVAQDRAKEINELTGMIKIFGEYTKKYHFQDKEDVIWTNVIVDYEEYPDYPHFSEDAAKCLWTGGTVSYLCMQLAYYMGFDDVYLIGFDHSYKIPSDANIKGCVITSASDDPNHFHPEYFGRGKRWNDPRLDRMELAYHRTRQVFEQNGRRIYNATAGGKLEIFPRVNYDNLFDNSGKNNVPVEKPVIAQTYTSSLQNTNVEVTRLKKEGVYFYETGDMPKAAAAFHRVLHRTPDDPESLGFLGLIALKAKNYEKSPAYFKTAIYIDPENVNYWVGLAKASHLKNDKKTFALAYEQINRFHNKSFKEPKPEQQSIEKKTQKVIHDKNREIDKDCLVTVIIPSYNDAHFLGQAVQSVLNQAWTNFEIIIVDDGSQDNTEEVAKSFRDSRIRYVRHEQNKGLSAARNTGLRHARGRYIAFLDADDYFLPHKLMSQVVFLEKYPQFGLVGSGSMRVDENGVMVNEGIGRAHAVFPQELFIRNRFNAHTTLIRKDWIDRIGYFDEELRAAEDWDFYCRLALAGCLMYHTGDVVCAYRYRSDSMSMDVEAQTKNLLRVVEKTFNGKNLTSLENQAKAYVHLRAVMYHYISNNVEQGKYHLAQALKYNTNFYKKDYEELLAILMGVVDHLITDSPVECFNLLFDNLPEDAYGMKALRHKVITKVKSRRLLKKFKNKHAGKRCVIIGTGNSLNKMDVSFLKNEITFVVDRFCFSDRRMDFDPNYYVCLDPVVFGQCAKEVLKTPCTKFLSLEAFPLIPNSDDVIFLEAGIDHNFVNCPISRLGDGYNPTYFAMQLAYYMGFDEVVIIGDDCDFNEQESEFNQTVSYKNHISKAEQVYIALDLEMKPAKIEISKAAYRLAKKTFESDGRHIVDATIGNTKNIVPRVDYRQIFSLRPYPKEYGNAARLNNTCQQHVETPKNSSFEPKNISAEPGEIVRPDAVININDLALSYEELGEMETARNLYESILKPLQNAIDGKDYAVCLDFESSYKLAQCYLSVCTKLAQCYGKQGAWDKVKRVYSGLLNRKNLILPEQQKQDILNVLKKLENVKIPEDTSQTQTIRSDSQYENNTPAITNTEISRPLVSVIIPAYNAEEYIAAAIESVLIQDYRDFELLIINDGSTDGTEEIIRGFKDDRIRYFRQENQGLAATHNTGIRQSRGEFIIKLDADDKMTPDFIARHIRQFEKHPEADLVYCDDILIDQNDKPIRIIKRPEYTDRKLLIRDMFRCGYPIVPFRTCIRKSVFGKIGFFDEGLAVGEDYDMMRRFVKHGLKICHLPGAMYLRRMTENSLSRNLTPQKAKCQFELVKRFTETFGYDELFPDVEWDKIPADQRQLNAKCLSVVSYLAIGQDFLNVHSTGLYANIAFQHACSELSDCLKIEPGNRQIRELLQKCELGRQRYEKHVGQVVC
jgi:glycosyltransferase involved in cell wall biosynthesis